MNTNSSETPYCNPCQSYHPVSQLCFDAATTARRSAPLPQSRAYQDAAAVEAKLGSITSAHSRTLEMMNWKLSAITTLRDACIEKVKVMRGNWHDQYVAADSSTREALVRKEMLFAQCCAARDIIEAIKSLTIDPLEPEKQK